MPGRKVEEAPVEALFAQPQHPYTRGLLARSRSLATQPRAQRLAEIPGMVPSLADEIDRLPLRAALRLATDRCRANSAADEAPATRGLLARAPRAARGT